MSSGDATTAETGTCIPGSVEEKSLEIPSSLPLPTASFGMLFAACVVYAFGSVAFRFFDVVWLNVCTINAFRCLKCRRRRRVCLKLMQIANVTCYRTQRPQEPQHGIRIYNTAAERRECGPLSGTNNTGPRKANDAGRAVSSNGKLCERTSE